MKNNIIAKLFIILILTIIVGTPIYFSLAQETKSTTDISFTANLYETSSYASEGEGIALTSSGTQIDAWKYDTSKYLQVNTTVPDDGNTYVVQVKTPQEFYIVSNNLTAPSGFNKVEFTKNEDLTVNSGTGTYQVNKYSGTANFTIENGVQTSTLQLQITYDTVLWNKINNSLLTAEGVHPLEVTLCRKAEDGSLEKVKNLYISKAYSSASWPFDGLNYYTYLLNGASTTVYQEMSIMSDKTVEYRPYLYTASQAKVYYYFKSLRLDITIPSYKDPSGKTHYLNVDTSKLSIINNAEFEIDESLIESEHKVIVTIKDLYFYSARIFPTGIIFSFPESLSSISDVTTFPFARGSLTYNIADKTGTYQSAYKLSLRSITYNTVAEEKVKAVRGSRNVTNIGLVDGAVNSLGYLSLQNAEGMGDSEAKNILYEFDTENTGRIKVTSVNLPADNYTEYFEIKYTLADENGKKVYLDSVGNRVEEGTEGAVSEWTYSLKNYYYNRLSDFHNIKNTLYRSNLPEEQQKYYFKTIKYSISKIRAGANLYGTGGPTALGSTGVFCGYVDGTAKNGEYANSTITISSTSGNFSEISGAAVTYIYSNSSTAYGITSASLNGKNNNKISITAGESFEISGNIYAHNYPYGSALWMRDSAIALVLPDGITVNEDSVKLWTKNLAESFKPESITRETASDGKIIWKIFAPSTLVIGGATEQLTELPEGRYLSFNIQLNTSSYMSQQVINIVDSLYCMSISQENNASGAFGSYAIADKYDLSPVATTIGCTTDTSAIEITPQSATFEINDDLEVTHNGNKTSGNNLRLYSKDDLITYNLKLNCIGGGKVNNFVYYMPIPKVDFNSGGYLVTTTEKAFDMKLLEETSISGHDLYNIYYTLDNNLNYSNVGNEAVTWYTAEEMTANSLSYSDVTIIKIIPKGDTIENGSQTTISIKLKYNGNDYTKEAGMTYTWSSCGYYTYIINGRETTGNFPTDGVTATLIYELDEQNMDGITLTAAKNMTPLLDGNIREFQTSIDKVPLFKNSQTFKITNVETYNINLNTKEYIEANTNMSGAGGNVPFGVTVKLNSGEEKNILSTASTNNITIGTVTSEGQTQFTYTLYNVNALSDASSTRYITVTYETDNGVILKQKINIQLELTEAEDPKSAIIDGNRYRIYDETTTEIAISQDSSFTAQFVSKYIPDLYTSKRLDFSSNMPVGTSIIILDRLQGNANYTYWYYNIEEETASISLDKFKKMGVSGTNYTNVTGQDEIEEIFLVLVNFKNSTGLAEDAYSLKLVLSGTSVAEVNSAELKFNIKNKRTFGVSTSSQNVKYGEDFTINYQMQASSGTETIYSGSKVSLVLTAKTSIPEDTYITANGTVYYHNSNNQFIIPCSNVIGDNGSVTMNINSNMLKHTGDKFELDVELWVGATSNANLPLMGQMKASGAISVQDETKAKASLKVTDITSRLIDFNNLNNTQTISFEKRIDSNCTVTVELQRKIGNAYEKVTDKLNSVNGNTTHNKGAYTLTLDSTATNSSIDFKLSTQTEIGTYRLVFKVYDKNGEQILEVPYSFLII